MVLLLISLRLRTPDLDLVSQRDMQTYLKRYLAECKQESGGLSTARKLKIIQLQWCHDEAAVRTVEHWVAVPE